MENFCECDIYVKSFNDLISFFLKRYNKFINIKGNTIKNKQCFIEMQKDYNTLLSLLDKFSHKAEIVINNIKKCPKEHSDSLEDIRAKVDKIEDFRHKINKHYEEIKKQIPKVEEGKEENKHKEMSDKEIMENDKKTIILIQNLLEDKDYKDKIKADKKDIIKIKNQLKDLVNEIEIELNKNDEQIDNIENNAEKGYELAEKGIDENLKEAAQTAVNNRRLKYQVGLSVTLGLIGSIIPGIGTLIGAGVGGALGGLIGYGAYKIDQHRLNQIEKEKQEEKKEK